MVTLVTTGEGRLDRSGSVVLNAAGAGTVQVGPVPAGQEWELQRMTVFCTGSNNPMPVCKVYDGVAGNEANLIDATYTGGQDVSDFGTPYLLQQQESLFFVWSGGVPGAMATARLIGVQRSA
jgi:hypothetical protein